MKGKRGKVVEIECLVCGEIVDIPPYIDFDKYDGQLVCKECGSLLHVKLEGSKVRKYKVVKAKFKPQPITLISDIPRPGDSEQKE
jgi:DNA-directed RNA polymerase subunit RPC12/RpoP